MTTVQFRNFTTNNYTDALSIEDVYRKFASFSGIHEFNFIDDISSFIESDWDVINNISYSNSYLERTDTLVANTISWYINALPHSYSIEFTAHESYWGIYLRAEQNGVNINSFLVEYDSEYITITQRLHSEDKIILKKELVNEEIVDWGRVRVSVRDEQFNSTSQGRLIYIGVWINGNLIVTTTGIIPPDIFPDLYIGFVISSGDIGIVYSDLKLANLNEIIIWSSLDPGEKAIGAITRAMEDRYLRVWMRWNGSLKAYRPKAREISYSFSNVRNFKASHSIDTRQVVSSIRLLGAFQWVKRIDNQLVRNFGFRHAEMNNTNLWDANQCVAVALEILQRTKEQVYQATFDTSGLVFLEYEDRFQIPNSRDNNTVVDYILDNGSWTYEDGVFNLELVGRKYFYGEP